MGGLVRNMGPLIAEVHDGSYPTNTVSRRPGTVPGSAAGKGVPSAPPRTTRGPAGLSPISAIPGPTGVTEGQADSSRGKSTAQYPPTVPEKAGDDDPLLCARARQAAASLKPAGASRSPVEEVRAMPAGKNELRLLCPPGLHDARLDSLARFRTARRARGPEASGSAARPGGGFPRPRG